ncbi:MAG TPA: M28 family peptidase [bacterium]|nr:M28 family peptidase [bacterium]
MQKDPERQIKDAISPSKLMRYTSDLSRWVRLSGSEEEGYAFDYLEAILKGFGLTVQRDRHDALISWPGEAALEVTAPARNTIRCITHSFAASTPPGGLDTEVVAVGAGYRGAQMRGKVALVDGLAMPGPTRLAEHAGALGIIFINPAHLYESIVSTVWGSPTPEAMGMLPKVVAVSVSQTDGAALRAHAQNGTLRVNIRAAVDTRWRKTPILIADLAGHETDRFILFSGHVDSWYHGSMDNGSANAVMVELARIFSRRRARLRRGIRFAFWSGHSHGRYSGSSWYADQYWQELYQRAVLHLNIDSPGGKGATVLSEAPTMAETWALAARGIRDVTGQELQQRRLRHNADQSFWGIGVPSMFSDLSTQPPAEGAGDESGGATLHHRLGWWWHTVDDTIDKVDRANLHRDAQVYALVLWWWCTAPVLPLDYRETVAELREVLRGLQAAAGDAFDMAPPLDALDRLAAATERLAVAMEHIRAIPGRGTRRQRAAAAAINDALMQLGRTLIPVTYTAAGPFDHDPAAPVPAIPGLQSAAQLGALAPGSDERKALHVRLIRERNKLVHAINTAIESVDRTVDRTRGLDRARV